MLTGWRAVTIIICRVLILSFGVLVLRAVDCFPQDLIGGKNVTIHLPRENRLCPLRNSNQVEDEIHFFFQCNKYSIQRQAFINQINRIIPDFDRKSSLESIKLITNSKEHHVNK